MTAPAVAAELRVRAMVRPELDLLLDWAAGEGWNPGLHDAARFPAPRPAFLASWISRPGVVALCAVEGSRVVGLGVLRPCREGRKVGPLLALDATVAASLLDALSAAAPGEPVFLDVPESNPAALALARARGMREVFGCARMYLGPPPRLPGAEVFGVTSLELG